MGRVHRHPQLPVNSLTGQDNVRAVCLILIDTQHAHTCTPQVHTQHCIEHYSATKKNAGNTVGKSHSHM